MCSIFSTPFDDRLQFPLQKLFESTQNDNKLYSLMQKYQILKKLGSGSFGHVEKAQNSLTKEIVAIKRLKKKYGTWEQCLQLSEVKVLRKLDHPNIIKLKEVVRVVNQAFFVFEFIEKDLFKLITERKEKGERLKDSEIRGLTKQIVLALQYIHKQGFFHRDLKPENILISSDLTAKIIDFGIAKEIRSRPPFTEYISTRWYRAPQILFKFPSHSVPVDIFALGCMVAEMYLMKPLFMGNSELDQISKLCSVMGSPANLTWPEGLKQANLRGINFPEFNEISLSSVIPNCPQDALDFISECLKWDPTKRITVSQMLNHPFLLKQLMSSEKEKLQDDRKKWHNPQYEVIRKPIQQNILSYKTLDEDDEFEDLLNNYSKPKEKSTFGIVSKPSETKPTVLKLDDDEDDQWF